MNSETPGNAEGPASRVGQPNPTRPSLRDWAVRYAEAGWPVFPLLPETKTPRFKGGFHVATADQARVAKWWTSYPNDNIATGIPANLWVLDVDGLPGQQTLARWAADHGELHTLAVRTNRGGLHLYFQKPDDFDGWIPQFQGLEPLPGIDTRVPGKGYVVLPPSVFVDEDGKRWPASRWMNLDVQNATRPPRWLVTALRDAKTKTTPRPAVKPAKRRLRVGGSNLDGLANFVAGTPETQRNKRLFWAACRAAQLVDQDVLTEAEHDAHVVAWAATTVPPLSEAVGLSTARSARENRNRGMDR